MTTNPRSIIIEVGQWCEKQPWHPSHAPDFGVLEEMGEFTHAVLKYFQGIRGFNDPNKFRDAITDAIGDMMVYLCHWCYMHKAYFTVYNDTVLPTGERILMMRVLIAIHRLMEIQENSEHDPVPEPIACQAATRFVSQLTDLARLHKIDPVEQLALTWDKVKRRNWNKDKMTGGEQTQTIQQGGSLLSGETAEVVAGIAGVHYGPPPTGPMPTLDPHGR